MARLEALTNHPTASTRKATTVNTTTIETSSYTPMRALRTARTVVDEAGRPHRVRATRPSRQTQRRQWQAEQIGAAR